MPVAVRTAGLISNFVTLTVAPEDEMCADLPGLTTAELEKLARGESVRLARAELARFQVKLNGPGVSEEVAFDLGWASLGSFTPAVLRSSMSLASVLLVGAPSPGACVVGPFNPFAELPLPAFEDPSRFQKLHAGATLNVNGPAGTKQLLRSNGEYLDILGGEFPGVKPQPLYLGPGAYTLDNGEGGREAGPFRAALTLPESSFWTNQEEFSRIDRAEDLTIVWASPDPDHEIVTIIAMSAADSGSPGAALLCTERAGAGRFTVPAWVLSVLPASAESDYLPGVPTGILGVIRSRPETEGAFQGTGIDVGRLGDVLVRLNNVEFR